MPTKLTTEQFIAKARAVHGNHYDYSLVEYMNNSTRIKIICPVHGIFLQLPCTHLRGAICKACSVDKVRHTKDSFIAKAREFHGDRYDYSLVAYKNNITRVIVICPTHRTIYC